MNTGHWLVSECTYAQGIFGLMCYFSLYGIIWNHQNILIENRSCAQHAPTENLFIFYLFLLPLNHGQPPKHLWLLWRTFKLQQLRREKLVCSRSFMEKCQREKKLTKCCLKGKWETLNLTGRRFYAWMRTKLSFLAIRLDGQKKPN